MKEAIKEHVESLGYDVEDYGVYDKNPVLYPDIAVKVAKAIADGKHEQGILICGTGIGRRLAPIKCRGSELLNVMTHIQQREREKAIMPRL